MFFKDETGSYWPVSRIRQIGPEREVKTSYGSVRRNTVYLDRDEAGDEERVEVSWVELQRLLRETAPIIPAQPNTFVVRLDFECEDPVFLTPVVSWCVSPDECLIPITVDGINDGVDELLAVLFPTGQVAKFHEAYHTLPEYVDSQRPSPKAANA